MFKKYLMLMIGIFLLLSFSLNFVNSAPPVTTVQQFTVGYVIESSPTEFIQQNTNYTLNFFVFNISNGVRAGSSLSCSVYIADSHGNLQGYNNVPFGLGYWKYEISGGNFTEYGHYPYGISCNSTNLGGATVEYFEVTESGLELTVGRAIMDIGLLLIFIIFLIGCVVLFMENDNLLARVGFFGLGYILLIIINFIAWNMAEDFIISTTFIAVMFKWLFLILMIGAFPLFLGVLAWYVIMLFKIKEIQNLMDHGFSEYDAQERANGGKKYGK